MRRAKSKWHFYAPERAHGCFRTTGVHVHTWWKCSLIPETKLGIPKVCIPNDLHSKHQPISVFTPSSGEREIPPWGSVMTLGLQTPYEQTPASNLVLSDPLKLKEDFQQPGQGSPWWEAFRNPERRLVHGIPRQMAEVSVKKHNSD